LKIGSSLKPNHHWEIQLAQICETLCRTERLTNLDKLKLVKFSYGGMALGLSLFSTLPPPASKNDASFKGGQMRLKTNHLASLV